jgi:hypothetical protein
MGFNIVSIASLDNGVPTQNLQPFVSVKRLTTQQRRKYKQPPPTTRCLVQFAPSPQGTAHIRSIHVGSEALDIFLSTEHQSPTGPPRSATYTTRLTLIKRSSSAQAPTRTKLQAICPSPPPPKGVHPTMAPPSSPARPTRRPHSDLLHIVLEEGDPVRDSLPRQGPYASLVPPFSPWNSTGKHMIGLHTPTGTVISPTLISPKRYAWLYAAHSRRRPSEDFTQDLLKLLARYNPRAKSLNPQGRKLKLTNH